MEELDEFRARRSNRLVDERVVCQRRQVLRQVGNVCKQRIATIQIINLDTNERQRSNTRQATKTRLGFDDDLLRPRERRDGARQARVTKRRRICLLHTIQYQFATRQSNDQHSTYDRPIVVVVV